MLDYTIIVPAHNEERYIEHTIRDLVSTFRRAQSSFEIILVSNGSTDQTALRALSLGFIEVSVIEIPMRGKGGALKEGFQHARGRVMAFTDADLSISPDEVLKSMQRYDAYPGAVLVGSRYHPDSTRPGRAWWRTMSSRAFHFLSFMLVKTDVSDNQCCLKVMDHVGKVHLLSSVESTWFLDLEFLARLRRASVRTIEIPVLWREHHYPNRRSFLRPTDVFWAVSAMLRIRRRMKSFQNASTAYNAPMTWTILGLGNPEDSYAKTRHNAGRVVLHKLHEVSHASSWSLRKVGHHEHSEGMLGDTPLILLRPTTYMNESGRAVIHLLKQPERVKQLVVMYDDAGLPIGTWKVSFGKGGGGHNGVSSIETTLHTKAFIRIRIGILPLDDDGAPVKSVGEGALKEFVLRTFRPEERTLLNGVAEDVAEKLPVLLTQGLEAFMLRAHTKDSKKQKQTASEEAVSQID
jgi:peptidyl-tRNA hydrolase, PTH1 family